MRCNALVGIDDFASYGGNLSSGGNNRACLYCVLGDSTLAKSPEVHVVAIDQIFECIDKSPTAYPPCALLSTVLSVCAVSFRLGQFAARCRGRTRTLSSKVRYFLHASTPFPKRNISFKWSPGLTLNEVCVCIFRDLS